MTEFCEVTQEERVPALAALAHEIWTEYYTPLLGQAQIAYMLDKFQSKAAMRRQMAQENYRYFFLKLNGETAGYLGVQIQEDALFLSKLYVRRAFRGRGVGRDTMAFLAGWTRGAGLFRIWLTVNRGNEGSIRSYERLGFENIGTQDADIGNGYVMDDYLFQKTM